MSLYDSVISLGLAFVVGLLIGLEREQSAVTSDEPDGSFLGGARTFPLIALLGAVSTLVAREVGVWVSVAAFIGVLVLVCISYFGDVTRGGDRGLTSEAALLLTFLLGLLSMSDGILMPLERKVLFILAVAVVMTLLLSVKSPLHAFAAKTSKEDVLATIKFLLVAVVVLPLLPNRTFGPLDVLNPFKIGMMIVLIGGVSFVGYVAIRVLGPGRGLGVTGLVGGLASSTAVTLTFSKRAKDDPSLASACALAVVLASTIMCIRVVVLVAVVSPSLAAAVAVPMGGMALASFGACAWLYRETKRALKVPEAEVHFSNPFELGSAVKLGALFAVVLFVAKAATTYAGTGGTYLTGLLAGATDVDAITLTMANMANKGLAAEVAVTTMLIGVASNTMVKAGIAFSLGGWALGRRVLAAFGVAVAGGVLGMIVIWLR